jgi:hypothetical protein
LKAIKLNAASPFFLVLVFFSLLNLFIVILDHYYFRTVALDFAVYNFAFFDYAHFRISPCPVYIFPFPATFLQDHFSLTLIFLSPFYWILGPITGTYTLLVLQWIFIVAGAAATYRLILLKSDRRLALTALVYYFVLFGRYSAYRADVNLAIIGSAMIPVFLYYFDLRKMWQSILCLVFLLFNREDYGLWLFFICILLTIIYRRDKHQKKLAFIFLIISALFFVLTLKVIIPSLEDENKKYALFDFTVVGETPLKALIFVLSHPLKAIGLLFSNHSGENYYDYIKANFYLVYIVSGGFVLFFRPWYLIPLIPLLAKKMYDDNPVRWSTETYYSIEFVSLMPVLVFIIICQFKEKRFRLPLAITVCSLSFAMLCYQIWYPPTNPIWGESNKYNFLKPDFYKPDIPLSDVKELMALIPEKAPVCGSCRLLPHLAFREKVYYFPTIRDAEFVILLKQGDAYPLFQKDFDEAIQKLKADRDWEVLAEKTGVILFKRLESRLAHAF